MPLNSVQIKKREFTQFKATESNGSIDISGEYTITLENNGVLRAPAVSFSIKSLSVLNKDINLLSEEKSANIGSISGGSTGNASIQFQTTINTGEATQLITSACDKKEVLMDVEETISGLFLVLPVDKQVKIVPTSSSCNLETGQEPPAGGSDPTPDPPGREDPPNGGGRQSEPVQRVDGAYLDLRGFPAQPQSVPTTVEWGVAVLRKTGEPDADLSQIHKIECYGNTEQEPDRVITNIQNEQDVYTFSHRYTQQEIDDYSSDVLAGYAVAKNRNGEVLRDNLPIETRTIPVEFQQNQNGSGDNRDSGDNRNDEGNDGGNQTPSEQFRALVAGQGMSARDRTNTVVEQLNAESPRKEMEMAANNPSNEGIKVDFMVSRFDLGPTLNTDELRLRPDDNSFADIWDANASDVYNLETPPRRDEPRVVQEATLRAEVVDGAFGSGTPQTIGASDTATYIFESKRGTNSITPEELQRRRNNGNNNANDGNNGGGQFNSVDQITNQLNGIDAAREIIRLHGQVIRRYDDNDNGEIDVGESGAAGQASAAGQITPDELDAIGYMSENNQYFPQNGEAEQRYLNNAELIHEYDENGNGEIDIGENGAAGQDFGQGQLSTDELEVIQYIFENNIKFPRSLQQQQNTQSNEFLPPSMSQAADSGF